MKNQWLAVIRDHDLSVARVAAGRNKEMKVMFLSDFKSAGTESKTGEVPIQDFAGIKNWLQKNHVPLKKLKLAVSSLGLITRIIALPQMTNDDLEMLITDHIDQYFTLNVQNYIIDYRILNKYWENERPMINVLLAAFPRERMEVIWSLCQYLGFEPMVVDLTADCLARLYSNLTEKVQKTRSPDSQPGAFPGDIAIVSLHADKVEFVLLANGTFFLYSDMELDLQAVSDRLDRMMKLDQKIQGNWNDQVQASHQAEDIPGHRNDQISLEDTLHDNEPILADDTDRQDAIVQQDDIISDEKTKLEDENYVKDENIPEDVTVPEDETPPIEAESISPAIVEPRWGTLIFAPDTGEIKLNLSSYTDDIQLISAEEAGYDDIRSSYPTDIQQDEPVPEIDDTSILSPEVNSGPEAGTEDTREVRFENVDELPGSDVWYDRDQLLNQLIGLEESKQDLLTDRENITIFDWDSTAKSFFATKATNGFADIQDNIDSQSEKVLPEGSAEDLIEVERMFFDGIDEGPAGLFKDESTDADVQFPDVLEPETDSVGFNVEEEINEPTDYQDKNQEQNTEDLFALTDDDIFLDLAKALPQLDFSIGLQQDDQPEPVELLDLGKSGLPFNDINNITLGDSILAPNEDNTQTENNFFDEDPIWIEEDEEEDRSGFRQAAITIRPSNEEQEEFILEDLFVPLDSLDEELAITLTKQDLAKQENLPEELETLAEASPGSMMEQNDNPIDQHLSEEEFSKLENLSEEASDNENILNSFVEEDNYSQDIFDSLADLQEISLGDISEVSLENIPEVSFDDFSNTGSDSNGQPLTDEAGDLRLSRQDTTVLNLAETSSLEEKLERIQVLDTDQLPNPNNEKPFLLSSIGMGERNIFDNLDLSIMIIGTERAGTDLSDRNPKEELEFSLSPVLATLSELLSFFAARHFGQTVHTIYLTGEFCDLPGLEEIFQENLGIRTQTGFPNGWKPQFEGSSKVFAAQWQKYGSLYGLALRED